MTAQWNPYYVEYARAHWCTPEEMASFTKRSPVRNIDFMQWVNARWAEWRSENGIKPDASLYPEHHKAYAAWLPRRVDALLAEQGGAVAVECKTCGEDECERAHDCTVCRTGTAMEQCDSCKRTVCPDCLWSVGEGPDEHSFCTGCVEDAAERESIEAEARDA